VAAFFALPGNERLASELAALTSGQVGQLEVRQFPDGETYVRVLSDVNRKDVFIVCTLARPDAQFVPLSFTASAIRQLGAQSVQLIAPYLAYMRQDRIFHPGEALASRLFAELLQRYFDRLITVDPHLHRHSSLAEVYDIPTTVVHAAPLLAEWIANHVDEPIIIGPDAESAQWVESIAKQVGAPWAAFEKERRADRDVRISARSLKYASGRTPVLADDIVSSGTTMKQALRILSSQNLPPAYCLAIHGLCSRRIARQLSDRSAGFLTCNTVPNDGAVLDVAPLIAAALVSLASTTASRDCGWRTAGNSLEPRPSADRAQ
jgi:ribose-phosphate pyrophosphokinase